MWTDASAPWGLALPPACPSPAGLLENGHCAPARLQQPRLGQSMGLAIFSCFAQAPCFRQAKDPFVLPSPHSQDQRGSDGPKSSFPLAALLSCTPAIPASGSSGIKGLLLPHDLLRGGGGWETLTRDSGPALPHSPH